MAHRAVNAKTFSPVGCLTMATQKRCIRLCGLSAAWTLACAPVPAGAGTVSATAQAFVTILDPMSVTPLSDLAVTATVRPARGQIAAEISPASYEVIAPPGETFSVESSRRLMLWRDDGQGLLALELDPARREAPLAGAGPDFARHRFAFGGSLPVSAGADPGRYSGDVRVIVNYN